MNGCAHHSIGHIGILGVDKKGEEFYQVMLGGSAGNVANSSIGKVVGPAFSAVDIPDAIDTVLQVYIDQRIENEPFIHLVNRLGLEVFKSALYPKKISSNQHKKAINAY